jgi:diguanylate cyclase (GGDEF)-like protein
MVVNQETDMLMTFLSCWKKWKSYETLFHSIDTFLEDLGHEGHSYLFSLPEDEAMMNGKSLEQSVRVLWNKAHLESYESRFFTLEDVKKMRMKQQVLVCEDKLIFDLGTFSEQRYIGVIEQKGDFLDKSLRDHFFHYVRDGFEQLMKWSDLDKYISLSQTDDVTGLYNQRKLAKDLTSLVEKNQITNEHFSILFIDIDHFKRVNDGHGHLIGTNLLIQMSKLLRKLLRDNDLVYRYGGDEFVIILPSANADVGKMVGERILQRIKSSVFKFKDDISFNLSVSIGIAEFPTHARTSEEVLELADKMMYEAKSKGRGMVCSACEMFG